MENKDINIKKQKSLLCENLKETEVLVKTVENLITSIASLTSSSKDYLPKRSCPICSVLLFSGKKWYKKSAHS